MNVLLTVLTWIAVIVHVSVAFVAWRRSPSLPVIAITNLVVGLGVLGYWVPRWYSYFAKGILWYYTDQLVPLYALIVVAMAVATIAGRVQATVINWLFFGVNTLVIVAAALFFSVFRMKRLI